MQSTRSTVSQTVIITRRGPPRCRKKKAGKPAAPRGNGHFLSMGPCGQKCNRRWGGCLYAGYSARWCIRPRRRNSALSPRYLAESVHAAGSPKQLIVAGGFLGRNYEHSKLTARPLPPASSAKGTTIDPRLPAPYGKGLTLAQKLAAAYPGSVTRAAMKPGRSPAIGRPASCQERCPCFCRCCGHCGAVVAPTAKARHRTLPLWCWTSAAALPCHPRPTWAGANGLARALAAVCGAVPVITSHPTKRCICGERVGKALELHRAGAGAHQAYQRCTAGGQKRCSLHPTGPLRVHRLMDHGGRCPGLCPHPLPGGGCAASGAAHRRAGRGLQTAAAPKRWPKPCSFLCPEPPCAAMHHGGGKHRLKTKQAGLLTFVRATAGRCSFHSQEQLRAAPRQLTPSALCRALPAWTMSVNGRQCWPAGGTSFFTNMPIPA